MGIASGELWLEFIAYLTNKTCNTNYTIEPSDKSYQGDLKSKEHQTIAVFPLSDYIVADENNISTATFNFQIINRISGKNTYGQITPFIADALNFSSDILLMLNNVYFHDSIIDIDSIPHNPVGVSRIDGNANDDWLIVSNLSLRVKWNNYYSGARFETTCPYDEDL